MPTFNLRQAVLTDLNQLVELENHCFTEDRMQRQHFRALLNKTSADIYIAESNQQIIGAAIVLFRKNSTQARIYSLAVHPTHRRSGVAERLCTALEKNAIKRGCETIVLEVRKQNLPAIHFYQKNHYEIFATYVKFYEDGMDALRMKKYL